MIQFQDLTTPRTNDIPCYPEYICLYVYIVHVGTWYEIAIENVMFEFYNHVGIPFLSEQLSFSDVIKGDSCIDLK